MSIKEELISVLKNDCGFTEKESVNLLESVKSTSEDQLKKDIEKFLKYISDITSKDSVIRMIALGFTDIFYNSENVDDFDIALKDKGELQKVASSKTEQTTVVSKMETVDYGPDCSSTPDAVAETNELESLWSMREAIQEIFDEFYSGDVDALWRRVKAMQKIEKVITKA